MKNQLSNKALKGVAEMQAASPVAVGTFGRFLF
jgi:hypothetical protein